VRQCLYGDSAAAHVGGPGSHARHEQCRCFARCFQNGFVDATFNTRVLERNTAMGGERLRRKDSGLYWCPLEVTVGLAPGATAEDSWTGGKNELLGRE